MTERVYFVVTDGPLSIRSAPATSGARIGELLNGTLIEVEAGSRTVADNFVWWKHARGWSAEGTADGRSIFMQRSAQAPVAPPAGSQPRFYQVVDGPVSIRANPDVTSAKLGELPNGTVIEVLADGRASAGGFAWVRHARGWSALGKSDGSSMFMQAVAEPAPAPVTPLEPDPAPAPVTPPAVPQVRYFKVVDGPVSIRENPDPNSRKLGEIANGTIIEVAPTSRTVTSGFVYWQHARGWSAERRVVTSAPFMLPTDEAPPAPTPTAGSSGAGGASPTPAAAQVLMPDGTPIQFFEVIEGPISIRREPSLSAERIGQFTVGEQFEVVPHSRTENEGYAWWQHSKGWSPERKLGAPAGYIAPIPKLTRRVVDGVPYLPVITQHPVALSDTQWIQYYGNTIFAYNLRREGKFWYNYCQALHGGFDYGTSKPVPIVAGVEGTVIDVNVNASTYAPNYTRLKVGPYIFIYGHMANPNPLVPGQNVGPQTVLGMIDAGTGRQNHLHLEVRHGMKILNPLEVMVEERRDEITARFKDFSKHFYSSPTWAKWLTPYDQPVLNLQIRGSEVIIGPHAR